MNDEVFQIEYHCPDCGSITPIMVGIVACIGCSKPLEVIQVESKAIRTGDTVLHRPSGETWLVACVQDDRLSWCGWPEGWAELKDCELVKACDDAAHWKLVETIAAQSSDHRGRYCRWLLEQRTA